MKPCKYLILIAMLSALTGCNTTQTSATKSKAVATPTADASDTWQVAEVSSKAPTVQNVQSADSSELIQAVIVEEPTIVIPPVEETAKIETVMEAAPEVDTIPHAGLAADQNTATRITPTLKSGSEKTLKDIDQIVEITNEQYNEIAQILAERDKGWEELYSQQSSMTPNEFKRKKKQFFKMALERYENVLTPDQLEIWHANK